VSATSTATAPLPRRLASLVRIEHTVFALPFAYVGALPSVDGWPGLATMGWITLAMVGARTLAMSLNRLIDAELDAANPRTAGRELPSGVLTRAQVLATIAVFVVTWATHSYQWWWLRGEILMTWPDTLFWSILGACVVVNVVIENRRRKQGPATPPTKLRQALDTAVTFSFIVVLWSLWNSPSVGEWLDVVTWWQIG
jgi:4-hydroxybenzoate polyprenyltransferase